MPSSLRLRSLVTAGHGLSLGEILKCEDKAAYACINSKRVDLLIVDDECL